MKTFNVLFIYPYSFFKICNPHLSTYSLYNIRFTDKAMWALPIQNSLLKLCINVDILAGICGREIGPLHGLYLQRTAENRKTWTYIHASRGIRTHDPSIREVQNHMRLRPCGPWDRPYIFIGDK